MPTCGRFTHGYLCLTHHKESEEIIELDQPTGDKVKVVTHLTGVVLQLHHWILPYLWLQPDP